MYSAEDLIALEEIKTFLETNGIEYTTEYDNFCFNHNIEGKRKYEIEYIPAAKYPVTNKKYGIEGVDGDYFFKKSHQAEHEHFSFKCWVKDYEWRDPRKREVLKSYWIYAAGKIKESFYARETEVRVVPTKEAREFESINCFYGKRGATLSLGLYTKKEKHDIPVGTLIMIYTFGNNFFGKDGSIEILRVGTKRFSNVIGGATKLLTHFIHNYPFLKVGDRQVPVNKLKFYSDYDHNIGGSMKELGMQFVSYSSGGFMNLWVETGEVKGREPMKHKLIMEKAALGLVLSIPNAGVKTFVLDIDRSLLPPPPPVKADPIPFNLF